uniref:Uncharacterized protein n=1 Tax=Anguilla anguilla TaxID=7936 RepID=A0A0E9UFI7_ANGAN
MNQIGGLNTKKRNSLTEGSVEVKETKVHFPYP